MKVLSLEGLTDYTIKLLEKIKLMLNEKADKDHIHDFAVTDADTVDGVHAWNMQTLDAAGSPHGSNSWLMKIQHNIDNDGYFKIMCGDGTVGTKVDMSSTSSNATNSTNSDKLDGYHGDSYVFTYGNYGANYFGSTDLNTWTRAGQYAIQSGCTNTPTERGTDVWGTIFIVKGLSDRISQYAVFWNETNQPLWHRCLNGSTWSTWKKVRDGGEANSATYSKYMTGWVDNRNINTIPNDYNSKFEVKGLKSNSSINSPDSSAYSTVMGLRAWHDSTGGEAHELAFTGNGQMFQRHGSTDTWGSWNRLYTSENITCGTSSLTSGSSSLASGNIYLQYE